VKVREGHEIITFCGPTKPRSYPWAETNKPFPVIEIQGFDYLRICEQGKTNN
jgi:hypothetical protein